MALRIVCLLIGLAACPAPLGKPASTPVAPRTAWVPKVCQAPPAARTAVDPNKARLIVQAIGHNGRGIADGFDVEVLDQGTSILPSAGCRPGIVEIYGLTPGRSIEIVISAPGYVPQRRRTALAPGDNSAAFWLGTPGMHYYVQGDIQIPYSRANARYLVLAPSGSSTTPSARHQKLLAAVAGVSGLSLEIVESVPGRPAWYNNYVEAEVGVRGDSADRRRAIGELARHLYDHPEQGRLVLALGERGTCFTGEIVVTFGKHVDGAERAAFADRYDLFVVGARAGATTFAMKAPDAAFPDLIEMIKREPAVTSVEANVIAPLQIDAS